MTSSKVTRAHTLVIGRKKLLVLSENQRATRESPVEVLGRDEDVVSPMPGGAATAPRSGAERDRTVDLRLAKPALSQLSYSPALSRCSTVGQGRLELPTSRLSGVRSNHLSYWPGAS